MVVLGGAGLFCQAIENDQGGGDQQHQSKSATGEKGDETKVLPFSGLRRDFGPKASSHHGAAVERC